jgi:hypothetical protein
VIFSGIPLVLSLIPSYSESALNHGKKLVGVLLMKAGLVLLIAVITGLVTLIYESVKVTNGVEGYMFVVFVICITMWGLFKYRSEIFEVASAGMVQGQQMVERVTTNSVDKMGDAGEKGFKSAKRMVGKAYKNRRFDKRLESFQTGAEGDGNGRKRFTNGASNNQQRSEHRKAVGENTSQQLDAGKKQEQQRMAKGVKTTAAAGASGTTHARSASRNAGAAIVNLDDYKSGKGEGAKKNNNSQTLQQSNRSVSEARNTNTTNPSEARNNKGSTPSTQRSSGNNQHQSSPHRKPSERMESQKEAAASREPAKHITQWEAQQQIKGRNANPTPDKVKRSESRGPKIKSSRKRK